MWQYFFLFDLGITCILGDNSVSSSSKAIQRVYDHQLVRTDSREQTLHAFIKPQQSATSHAR